MAGLSERVRSKLGELRERVGEKADVDEQEAREQVQRVARAGAQGARRAGKATGGVATRVAPGVGKLPERDRRRKTRTQEMGERAQQAGEARAPVDAGLHLTKDPRSIESFAASPLAIDAGGLSNQPEAMGGGAEMGLLMPSTAPMDVRGGRDGSGTGDYEYGPGERPPDPMDVRTNQQLEFGHSLLHGWVDGEPGSPTVDNGETDWTAAQVEAEHERLIGLMADRGIEHDSPIGDVDGNGRSGDHPHDFEDPFGVAGGGR